MESRDIYDLEHELRERDERLRERAAESVAKAQLVLQSEASHSVVNVIDSPQQRKYLCLWDSTLPSMFSPHENAQIPGEDAPRDELVRLSDSIGLEDMTHSMDEHDTAGPREYERINFERILDPEIDGRSGTVSGRT